MRDAVGRKLERMLRPVLYVLGAIGLALAGLALTYRFVPLEWLLPMNDAVGNYLQTVGTVYAVLLAFVVFVVWGQHNDALTYIHHEANDLLDMDRIIRSLPAPFCDEGARKLCLYTDALLGKEWEAMQVGGDCSVAWVQLEDLWSVLQRMEPSTPREEALYSEILTCFNDLSDARADRIRSAQTHIPSILWALLLTGASVMVGSMYLFAIRDFGNHAVMTGALAGALSHVLYVIWDLDN